MTTRKFTRCMFVPSALARAGVGPALALALLAGAAVGQPAPKLPQPTTPSSGQASGQSSGQTSSHASKGHTPSSSSHSSTADAASSMMSERSAQEQASKKKIGDSAGGGDVQVNSSQIVDLHVKDEDLTRVLELLAIQSQRNIIPTKSVSARVSANLYGVTFYEALDALLHPNGYGWMERNNRIEVYTLEELKQIEAASRSRIAKVIKLNYLNAVDAGAFVEALLSEGGQIKTNGKTPGFTIPEKSPVGQDDYANDAMLVVYDFEENVSEIERLIKEIDTRPSQVLVEATILQTQLNEANAFGVDFAVLGDLNFTDFSGSGGPLTAVNSLIAGKAKTLGSGDVAIPGADGEGRAVVSSPGNTAGPGTLKIGFTESDVSVFIRMLDEVGDTTIISNPKVLALNRQPARVLVGRKVGYLNTTSTDTTTTQSVEFLDTGTQLYFRPFVTNEGLIRLELKPAVSEAVIRDAKDVTGAAVTIPDEITNEIVTNVIVRDGQTVVLGGLFRESTQSSRRQVPLLGDIPLLGAAFRGHDDSTTRNEIIFMIKPSIVSDQVLVMQGERGMDIVDRARTGARDGLLLWSRERQSGQRLVEAERLASEGKDKEALWKIEQSLNMNHNQPEAIALREKITGKKESWPSRSMLDDIVKGEAAATHKPTSQANDTAPKALPEARTSGVLRPQERTNSSVSYSPAPTPLPQQHSTQSTPNSGNAAETPNAPSSAPSSASSSATDNSSASDNGASNTPSTPSDENTPADQPPVPLGDSSPTPGGASGASTTSPSTSGSTQDSSEFSTGLSQLGSGELDATPSHNEQGSTSGTTTCASPSPSSNSSTTPTSQSLVEASPSHATNYIAAWSWFFGAFRNVYVQNQHGDFVPASMQAAAPGTSTHDQSTGNQASDAQASVTDPSQVTDK